MRLARSRWARPVAGAVLLVLLPLVAEVELVAWVGAHDAATLMLGAAAGSARTAVAAMALALLLRVYVVVALPGLCMAWIVMRAGRALARRMPVRQRSGSLKSNPSGSNAKSSNPMP
jgi:hypothetical protein